MQFPAAVDGASEVEGTLLPRDQRPNSDLFFGPAFLPARSQSDFRSGVALVAAVSIWDLACNPARAKH